MYFGLQAHCVTEQHPPKYISDPDLLAPLLVQRPEVQLETALEQVGGHRLRER